MLSTELLAVSASSEEQESFMKSNETDAREPVVNLKKNVTIINGVGLIVGSIIGSGIFISPGGVLKNTGSVGLSLIVWVACGVISLMGALCYGELGTEIMKSGAEHAYLLEAFGPLVAFLFSWASTLIIRPSAATIIAMIFAEYVAKPFYEDSEVPTYIIKLLAFFCIVVITAVNCVSVRLAIRVQDVFMYSKLLCIAILIVVGFIALGKGHTSNFDSSFNGTSKDVGMISIAFYSGLWAYDGWNTLNYVTEEMKNPARDLPISIVISMVIVTGCYIIVNVSYIAVLGKDGILNASAVALDVGADYLGKARFIIPVLVAASCFGAVNGLQFSSGRLVYAAAREGHLPSILAMIQVKRLTPLPSLVFLALISCVMLIPKSADFQTLVDYYSFAAWCFYGGCFVALIYLRFSRKEMKRPYKVFLPVAFLMVLVSLFLIILPIYQQPVGAAIALGMILLGVPFYFVLVRFDLLPSFWHNFMGAFTSCSTRLCDVSMPEDESAFVA